ncbi:MAG: V-type ATP synthase subunit E [Theionarchaea archaeon]|nr:V-type ATP synthase subunit E [Theionarchaea archaeon]MBU7038427.1 V-type ATP synthase subunit E [Theionarchaea archaeon]
MGVEDIKRKIITDAEKEKEKILEEAREKAAHIMDEKRKSAQKRKEEILSRAEKDGEMEKSRILTIEKLESRKNLLAAKQTVIQRVFDAALEHLSASDEYEGILAERITHVAHGGEEIILSPRDRKHLGKAFFDRVNSTLSQPLTPSTETRNIAGGFILKRGDIEINESFDMQMRELRDDMEREVAHILFSGDSR